MPTCGCGRSCLRTTSFRHRPFSIHGPKFRSSLSRSAADRNGRRWGRRSLGTVQPRGVPHRRARVYRGRIWDARCRGEIGRSPRDPAIASHCPQNSATRIGNEGIPLMGSRYRIMVVEDSETQALKMRYVLEAEGWEVISASSAETSLDALNRTVPDLIVVDYH